MIQVLIVAAYASMRAGLNALLAEAEDCQIIGEVSGSAEVERLWPELRPDVVLFDYQAGDSACLIETLAEQGVGLVVLGDTPRDFRQLANSPLPGWAYLRKEAEGDEIAGALRAVAAGLIVLDRSVSPLLGETARTVEVREEEVLLPDETLTAREREVLQQMAQGLPNKQIATKLSISQHTVKFHVASILAKLGASSRTEAVTMGARRGFVLL